MLDSIVINNYRNLQKLKIKDLKRINLITGKNNTGKSSILEAIAIFVSNCDRQLLFDLLKEKSEYNLQNREHDVNSVEQNLKSFSSLFTNRTISFDKNASIFISNIENTIFGEDDNFNNAVSIRFVRYINEERNDFLRIKIIEIEEDVNYKDIEHKIGIELKSGLRSEIFDLGKELRRLGLGFRNTINETKYQYIRTRNIDSENNSILWDSITLTNKEDYVIDALKIIEPKTERITFIGENRRERIAVIKLKDSSAIVPLRSMGDGINRILTIILALVNSENGVLLIDEFENGLHYSIQENLWHIIVDLSQKLNIQLFITTHSEDCIQGFENIINSGANENLGKLIRLDKKNELVKIVEFSAKELKIATENEIEIR